MDDSHYCMFIDVLGFARSQLVTATDRFSPVTTTHLLQTFHSVLRDVVASSDLKRPTVIGFSDSAFIATRTHAAALCSFASRLMSRLIMQSVPARAGISRGTFLVHEFGSVQAAEIQYHSAQFYGTGVVTAYYAESRTGPGMRVFLHPTFVDSADHTFSRYNAIPLDSEQTAHATHELRYLSRYGEQPRGMVDLTAALDKMADSSDEWRRAFEGTVRAAHRMFTDGIDPSVWQA